MNKIIFTFCALLLLASCAIPGATPVPAATTATGTPFLPPTTIPAPPSPETVSYYRIRLEYTTSSDWSSLELLDPQSVLTMRVIGTRGEPQSLGTDLGRLALNQPLADAQAGTVVGVTVEYAVDAAAIDQPLEFHLQKGAVGGSTVRLYNLVDGQAALLQTIDHQGVVQGNPGLNPLDFQIDLSGLQEVPLQAQVARPAVPRMVWAFYYPWYSPGDWSSEILQDHPLIRYDSSDPETIARQVDEAQSAGIDGFISSWWGPGSDTDFNLQALLAVAAQKDFRVTVYFETLDEDGGRDGDQIYEWLAYLITTFGSHPAFMQVDGRPLVVVWASGAVPLATWQEVFARLEARGLGATYLAMGTGLANLEPFDGLHQYGVFTDPDLAGTEAATGRAVRSYTLLDEGSAPRLWAATVQPGYDERTIPGRSGLYQDREDGAFYRRTWEAAIQSDPDWIFITTWNEWWEHTYIEPGERYGDLYLQITAEYARSWKGLP